MAAVYAMLADSVRACVEVFVLTFAEAHAEFVRINARELKRRSISALVTEQALEMTLHPKNGHIILQGFLHVTWWHYIGTSSRELD